MAERMAFQILEMDIVDVENLSRSIINFKKGILYCKLCGLISEQNPCKICSSDKRDHQTLCLVKNVQDAFMIEKSGGYLGLYHVLGGLLSPIDRIDLKNLNINNLEQRMGSIKEVIFAMEQTVQAEATVKVLLPILFKAKPAKEFNITRLAMGIPSGTSLEYMDEDTLKHSLSNRITLS